MSHAQRLPARSVMDNRETPFSMFAPSAATYDGPEVGALRSTHLAPTPLAERFFSAANLDEVQRRMRDVIRERMGYVIDRQSDQELLAVMRWVYVQFGRNEGGDAEVRRLNELVLREVVPAVASGLSGYLEYLRYASELPTPMARGSATSVKGRNATQTFRPL